MCLGLNISRNPRTYSLYVNVLKYLLEVQLKTYKCKSSGWNCPLTCPLCLSIAAHCRLLWDFSAVPRHNELRRAFSFKWTTCREINVSCKKPCVSITCCISFSLISLAVTNLVISVLLLCWKKMRWDLETSPAQATNTWSTLLTLSPT